MLKGTTLLWIALYGAVLFLAGFFLNKVLTGAPEPGPMETYMERLTERLELSDDQQEAIRRLLDEEDREIEAVFTGEHAAAVKNLLSDIRKATHDRIGELLDERQKELFDGTGIEDRRDYNAEADR